MKVWLLTTEYPPFYGGGIGTYCMHTVRMLESHGHRVTVFVNDDSIGSEYLEDRYGETRIVRFTHRTDTTTKHLGHTAAVSFKLSEIVEAFVAREGPPDIIESQEYLGLPYFLLQKKRALWPMLQATPIIVTLHSPTFVCKHLNREPIYRLPDYWIGEMERFCIRAADLVISPSRYLIDEIERSMEFRGQAPAIVPHPYSRIASSDKACSSFSEGEQRNIVFLGRLEYLKGVTHLMDVFRELWDEGVDLRLRLIGGDTLYHPKGKMMSSFLRGKYRRYFEEERVSYDGLVPPNVLPGILSGACAVIVPSLTESFSYSVLESLSLGSVVVASSSGAPREIIRHGIDGFLFDHGQAGSLRDNVLHAMKMDHAERQRIGKNAQQRVAELFSYETVYSQKMKQWDLVRQPTPPLRRFPFIRGKERDTALHVNEVVSERKGLLSVVVPYYNMGRYVVETLDSLKAVTYRPCEIIIVNDGSDDPSSMEMLSAIERTYPVTVLHKKNGGLASARNAGARHASGEFIAFLDPDDLVVPEYYEWAIRLLAAYDNVSFVGAWTQAFEASDVVWPAWNPEFPYLAVHNTVNSSGLLLRRADFLRCGLNASAMEYGWEDYEYVINMVRQGCRGVIIPKPLHWYRIRPDSMYRQMKSETMLYSHQVVAERHREVFAEYGVEIFNLLNSNGPSYLYDNPTFEAPQPIRYCGDVGVREILFLGLRRLYRALPQSGTISKCIAPFRDSIRSMLSH